MPMLYTTFDERLAGTVILEAAAQDLKVEFQFPPKITSDSRKGEWSEKNQPGTEPVATYTASGPRETSLTYTYIVDGGKWTTDKIAQQVSSIRSYFSRYLPKGAKALVFRFRMWKFGGSRTMSYRLKSVDVKHSETIVAPNGDVSRAYALRTDITLELRMWTKGGPNKTQDVPGLELQEVPGWY